MSEQNSPEPLTVVVCVPCGHPIVHHDRGCQSPGCPCNVMGPARTGADLESGLPQSALGGLHPELRARITAAKAVLTDHGRFAAGLHGRIEWETASHRLYSELAGLIDAIERLDK